MTVYRLSLFSPNLKSSVLLIGKQSSQNLVEKFHDFLPDGDSECKMPFGKYIFDG